MKNKNCTDYWLRNGKMIGEFEEMYKNIDDPWGCSLQHRSLNNRLFFTMITANRDVKNILEIGCGKGEFLRFLTEGLPHGCRVSGCDISETAIKEASRNDEKINFFVSDIRKDEISDDNLSAVIMNEIIWYILPELTQIFGKIYIMLEDKGKLYIKQRFFKQEEQTYGKEYLASGKELIEKYLKPAGFNILNRMDINPEESHVCIIECTKQKEEKI